MTRTLCALTILYNLNWRIITKDNSDLKIISTISISSACISSACTSSACISSANVPCLKRDSPNQTKCAKLNAKDCKLNDTLSLSQNVKKHRFELNQKRFEEMSIECAHAIREKCALAREECVRICVERI